MGCGRLTGRRPADNSARGARVAHPGFDPLACRRRSIAWTLARRPVNPVPRCPKHIAGPPPASRTPADVRFRPREPQPRAPHKPVHHRPRDLQPRAPPATRTPRPAPRPRHLRPRATRPRAPPTMRSSAPRSPAPRNPAPRNPAPRNPAQRNPAQRNPALCSPGLCSFRPAQLRPRAPSAHTLRPGSHLGPCPTPPYAVATRPRTRRPVQLDPRAPQSRAPPAPHSSGPRSGPAPRRGPGLAPASPSLQPPMPIPHSHRSVDWAQKQRHAAKTPAFVTGRRS
ncbi:hypothetical protein BKA15_001605 [Microlunatus parietis]|uniref:Uncharacterized protein n=1 Tax=Microlunatus parietis TaxID=682979 RepID=A0A7Y9LBY0_9ACTN|nr:hypothetical protein [Microlunatus parietis]